MDYNQIPSYAAVVSALAAVVALFFESRAARRTLGAETYRQLEEKFYHTKLMRNLRRDAAKELEQQEKYDAFDDLADFFDHIGILVRRGVLDEEMAWSSFYRRAAAFWDEGQKKGVIAKAKTSQPLRWNEYEYLLQRLKRIHMKKCRGSSDAVQGYLPDNERDVLLAQERKLPQGELDA